MVLESKLNLGFIGYLSQIVDMHFRLSINKNDVLINFLRHRVQTTYTSITCNYGLKYLQIGSP
jgi:hypothetical protein